MLAPVLLAALAPRVLASDDFMRDMDKGDTRKSAAERAEYFDRAISEWSRDDGQQLLAYCHLRRGEARYDLFDFKDAEPDLSQALDIDPGSARAYLLRGRIRLRDGRAKDAVDDLAEYTVLKDDDVEGWLALGQAQAALERWQPAGESFARAEQVAPADARPPLEEARMLMRRRQWPQALARLDAAAEPGRKPGPEVFLERGVCEIELGRNDQALAEYSKAIPLFDRRLDDLRRARAQPKAVAELGATAARAYYERGRLYEFMSRPEDAADDYGEACQLGHAKACGRLRALRPQGAQAARPKPRRARRASDDAGDRIYAN